MVLGLNDGIVTTLVFLLSVSAASGSMKDTVVAGLSELFAGGAAMFLGGFTAARATKEAYHYQVEVEREEIRVEPSEEQAEIVRMYRDKGFEGVLLGDIVRHVTSDPERWLKVMVRDELGKSPDDGPATWRVGASVGGAFMLGALVPLISFIIKLPDAQAIAIALSVLALVLTGAVRSRFSRKTWWASAGEMVVVGVCGSAAGIVIGALLSRWGQ
jgi:VIT1/CCC1 family predicted Fe2+/Mn2+ transporter